MTGKPSFGRFGQSILTIGLAGIDRGKLDLDEAFAQFVDRFLWSSWSLLRLSSQFKLRRINLSWNRVRGCCSWRRHGGQDDGMRVGEAGSRNKRP